MDVEKMCIEFVWYEVLKYVPCLMNHTIEGLLHWSCLQVFFRDAILVYGVIELTSKAYVDNTMSKVCRFKFHLQKDLGKDYVGNCNEKIDCICAYFVPLKTAIATVKSLS